tara:strand:+ start:17581 stop:18186 length:606 start_codon:yes stop_codon:yes gene_type:complete
MTLSHSKHSVQNRSAFTIVEIMLAIALSSLVALTALLMLQAIGTATESRYDTRIDIVERELLMARLGGVIRTSSRALASSDNSTVLWKGDINANGFPDLSEIQLIVWTDDDTLITSYETPNPPISDPSYALDADFVTITNAIAGSSAFPSRVLIDRVVDTQWSFDNATIQDARTARLDISSLHPTGVHKTTLITSFRRGTP